jgi:TPR repeat protein
MTIGGSYDDRWNAGFVPALRRDRRDRDPSLLEDRFQGCALGASSGCHELAKSYELGKGTEANPARALELYTRLCLMGDGDGCWSEARLVKQGAAGQPDPHRIQLALRLARAHYEEDCDPRIFPQFCKRASALYDGLEPGLSLDPSMARHLRALAIRGFEQDCQYDPEACREAAELKAREP